MTDQRQPYVGGNWKMNLNLAESRDLAKALAEGMPASAQVDTVVTPAFVYLEAVSGILSGSAVKLGAQNFYFQGNGAYTGEVSLAMLKDVGVSVVLVGHSERRHVLGESDTLINEKVLAALEAGMQVILCVGETLVQRQRGQTNAVNMAQLGYGLAAVSKEQMSSVTIAYEPVWAIGTGKTATPDDAQSAHQFIRATLSCGLFDLETGNKVRIQYGGSVKPGNAQELAGKEDVDGFLVGGASLVADDFLAIIEAAAS